MIGNTFKDDYPAWIWRSLRNSRKGKDVLNPFFRLINATQLYPLVFKTNSFFWAFGMGSAIVMAWGFGRGWNYVWKRINHGKLYADCPYVYPADEDD